jgi:hypothetical protein
MAYRRFQPAGYRVNIFCIPIGRNTLAQSGIFRVEQHLCRTAWVCPRFPPPVSACPRFPPTGIASQGERRHLGARLCLRRGSITAVGTDRQTGVVAPGPVLLWRSPPPRHLGDPARWGARAVGRPAPPLAMRETSRSSEGYTDSSPASAPRGSTAIAMCSDTL